eukprot:756048-Hanusia_phi.AAC.4
MSTTTTIIAIIIIIATTVSNHKNSNNNYSIVWVDITFPGLSAAPTQISPVAKEGRETVRGARREFDFSSSHAGLGLASSTGGSRTVCSSSQKLLRGRRKEVGTRRSDDLGDDRGLQIMACSEEMSSCDLETKGMTSEKLADALLGRRGRSNGTEGKGMGKKERG